MKVNMYDFDKTIYKGDSSVDFIKYCIKNKYIKLKDILIIIWNTIKYLFGCINITELKEKIFSFLKNIENIDNIVSDFWVENKHKIKEFYKKGNHKKDIINSASPYFLLENITKELGVMDLIASDVNKKTGKFNKPNNSQEEKIKTFKYKYPDGIIIKSYSDSLNDLPMLKASKEPYIVSKEKIIPLNEYKMPYIKNTIRKIWKIYRNNIEIISYLIIGGLTTIISILSYYIISHIFNQTMIISNTISWILSVIFAYFTNRIFVFKSQNKKYLKEFISFTGSRVLTFIMDTILMIVFVETLKLNDIIAKIIVQIFVIIGNYIISKLIIFRK